MCKFEDSSESVAKVKSESGCERIRSLRSGSSVLSQQSGDAACPWGGELYQALFALFVWDVTKSYCEAEPDFDRFSKTNMPLMDRCQITVQIEEDCLGAI